MSTKDAVIEMIRRMPDNATLPEIMEELYVRQKIDEGIRQLDAGEGIPHKNMKRSLAKWLNGSGRRGLVGIWKRTAKTFHP